MVDNIELDVTLLLSDWVSEKVTTREAIASKNKRGAQQAPVNKHA